MSRHTIPMGRVLGIPLELDYSWFLVLALLTWALAVGHYPAEFKGWSPSLYWIMGAITAVMLFVSGLGLLVRGQILWGIAIMVTALLVGPGGVFLFA